METKQCSKCKEVKPVSTDFAFRNKKADKPILHSRCRQCMSEATAASRAKRFTKEEYNEHMVEYRKTPVGAVSWIKTKARRCGLEGDEVDRVVAAFEASTGECEICGNVPQEAGYLHGLYIDHCHERLVFRGLLCSGCNTLIGYAKDDAERLMAASRYVTER